MGLIPEIRRWQALGRSPDGSGVSAVPGEAVTGYQEGKAATGTTPPGFGSRTVTREVASESTIRALFLPDELARFSRETGLSDAAVISILRELLPACVGIRAQAMDQASTAPHAA